MVLSFNSIKFLLRPFSSFSFGSYFLMLWLSEMPLFYLLRGESWKWNHAYSKRNLNAPSWQLPTPFELHSATTKPLILELEVCSIPISMKSHTWMQDREAKACQCNHRPIKYHWGIGIQHHSSTIVRMKDFLEGHTYWSPLHCSKAYHGTHLAIRRFCMLSA